MKTAFVSDITTALPVGEAAAGRKAGQEAAGRKAGPEAVAKGRKQQLQRRREQQQQPRGKARSRRVSEDRARRFYEDRVERSRERRRSCAEEQSRRLAEQCPFSPQRAAGGSGGPQRRRGQRGHGSEAPPRSFDNFLARNEAQTQRLREWRIRTRSMNRELELEPCTFHPETSRPPKSEHTYRRDVFVDLYLQGLVDKQFKEDVTLARERELKEQELHGCTFQPRPSSPPPAPPAAHESGASSHSPSYLQQYLSRSRRGAPERSDAAQGEAGHRRAEEADMSGILSTIRRVHAILQASPRAQGGEQWP